VSAAAVSGIDASTLLGALPVGLQLWDAAGDDPAGLALVWSNHDAGSHGGESYARAALAGESIDVVEDCGDAGWCRVRARPLSDSRVMVTFEDVTEAHERERALAASERLNASIIESLQEALIVIDMSGRITRANLAAAALCGVTLGELVGGRLRDLPIEVRGRDGNALAADRSPVRLALAGETVRGMLIQVVRRDGTSLWAEANASPLAEADGQPYGALSTYVDVTGRVEREKRIRAEAETDDLTGLANRRALQRMLRVALDRARAHGLVVCVLMLDLDGFKAVNDRFGHATGDAALREVAARLRSSVRERDMVARAGGDEFVVVLPDLVEGDAHAAAERVEAAFATPLELGGVQASLHAAVGLACYPGDGQDADVLLAAADRAMYARKSR
jgi:diguanylate cyclase (GGDEF)-like protein/PAS domain S-box-containing protein